MLACLYIFPIIFFLYGSTLIFLAIGERKMPGYKEKLRKIKEIKDNKPKFFEDEQKLEYNEEPLGFKFPILVILAGFLLFLPIELVIFLVARI